MSMFDDLKEFEKLSKTANRYESIRRIINKSRNLKSIYKGSHLDSKYISCALYDNTPSLKHNNHSNDLEKELYDYISDTDIIESIMKSLKYSTKDNIQYIYLDTLDEYDMSRVRFIVNRILSEM